MTVLFVMILGTADDMMNNVFDALVKGDGGWTMVLCDVVESETENVSLTVCWLMLQCSFQHVDFNFLAVPCVTSNQTTGTGTSTTVGSHFLLAVGLLDSS